MILLVYTLTCLLFALIGAALDRYKPVTIAPYCVGSILVFALILTSMYSVEDFSKMMFIFCGTLTMEVVALGSGIQGSARRRQKEFEHARSSMNP